LTPFSREDDDAIYRYPLPSQRRKRRLAV